MNHGGSRDGAGRPNGKGRFHESSRPVRLPVSMISRVMKYVAKGAYALPLYSSKIQAGFPSPADDYIEKELDLNAYLVKHPSATFLVKATGESMIGAGIHQDDILVVDRSLTPVSGKIVIAAVDGQLTVKRLEKSDNKFFLMPENEKFAPIEVKEGSEVYIWGVVTTVIHPV
jgi:DNA polymerase V